MVAKEIKNNVLFIISIFYSLWLIMSMKHHTYVLNHSENISGAEPIKSTLALATVTGDHFLHSNHHMIKSSMGSYVQVDNMDKNHILTFIPSILYFYELDNAI